LFRTLAALDRLPVKLDEEVTRNQKLLAFRDSAGFGTPHSRRE
jgi:hypothetical protein